jgi:hypothetical protein
LYDPACFVDDDDLYGPTRDAAEREALPTGPGFDEPFSVDAWLANLKDPAAEEEESQQEQNKGNEQGMRAAAAAAAPSAPSRAASSRAGKKGKNGKIPQADWDEQDRLDAMEILQKNTAPTKSNKGCTLWQVKQRTVISFRKVTYPSFQAFAFAVHHPDLPLYQKLTAEAKCGNERCISPDCLRLVYDHQRGAKGDNFPELTAFDIVGLQRDAETDKRVAMQYERSCHTAVFALHDARQYAHLQQWLKLPA